MKTVTLLSILAAIALSFFGLSVEAAVPASMSTAISGVSTDGLALLDLVIPVVAAIFSVMTLIKLFKRAGSKI